MKEHKSPLEYLKEHEGILPKTVGLAILCRLMEEYSDQQNAELRERVKELEGALTATLNVARAYDRSRFVDILDKAEKTLKK